MAHKRWKLLLSSWTMRLALAIVTLLTSAADSNAQETLTPQDRSRLRDEYGYLASEWSGDIAVPIVLLEKIH